MIILQSILHIFRHDYGQWEFDTLINPLTQSNKVVQFRRCKHCNYVHWIYGP